MLTAEWFEIVIRYGAVAVLMLGIYMFARGQIVSKKLVDRIEQIYTKAATDRDKVFAESLSRIRDTYEANIKTLKEEFELTLKSVCNTFENTTKLRCDSFDKQVETLKDIIEIFRKHNGFTKKEIREQKHKRS